MNPFPLRAFLLLPLAHAVSLSPTPMPAAPPVETPLLSLDTVDGVKPSMRPKGAASTIELLKGEGNSSDGGGAIRLRGTSPTSKGNKYFSVSLSLKQPVDLTRRRVLLDARTTTPEDTRAFYVRFYNRGETKPAWSFHSWDGLLQSAWRTFSFQTRLSPDGLRWETDTVADRVADRVDRVEVIIGTSDDNRTIDVSLDRLRTAPPLLTVADLQRPKNLVRDTFLVRDGKPAATILHPDTAAGRQAAQAVAAAVHARTGATLPARPATRADRDSAPDETLLLLGNVDQNPALHLPYARFLTPVDTFCPGPGGFLVHTIHDPFGKGANEVVLGACDDAGLAKAAAAFAALVAKLAAGPTLALPRTFERDYAGPFLKRYGWAASKPSAKRLEDGLASGRKALAEGRHCSIAGILQTVALRYQFTRHPVEARLFVALWDLYAESAVADPRKYGGPWGFDSDFPSAEVVCGWDTIEEDPSITDEERLRVTKIMARWLAEAVIPKVGQSATRVPHNHQTFPGLGALMAGLYLSRDYDVVEGRKWLAIADSLFKPQATRFKPMEDCNGYQWLTNGHQMRYALARPDFTLFTAGAGHKVIDYCIGTMNNLGYQVPYGDTGSWQCWSSEIECLDMFAYATGDPAATWAAAFKRKIKKASQPYAFTRSGDGERPSRFDGVKVWPLEPVYYQTFPSENGPALERCFDKITFREALDPAAPYLLLDGLSNGGHKHLDGNSIPQLTQFERIWLADNDYIKAQTKYHNTALVFVEGQATTIPDYAELLGAGETPRHGFSRTRVSDYSGADWDRAVVWLKAQKAFVVLDRMRARRSAEYQFRILWQGVGEPAPSSDGMLLRQKGPSMRIQTAPGPRVSVAADPDLGATWRGYPFADPVTHTMTATATTRLDAGDSYLHATILHGRPDGDAAPWPITHLDGVDAVRITTPDGPIVVGLGPTTGPVPAIHLATDAMVWIAEPRGLTLLNATRASIENTPVHQSKGPTCADVEAPVADALAKIPDRAATPNIVIADTAPAHPITWTQRPVPDRSAPTADKGAPPAQDESYTFTRIVPARLGTDPAPGLYAATRQGTLLALRPDGSTLWTKTYGAAINDVAAAELDGDGKDEAILGRQDFFVTALDDDARELWSREIPYYRERPTVACAMAGDLDGDGRPEVVAGAHSWRFYAFRADGQELWNYETVRKSLSGAIADIDGDGRDEILCGTEYYSTTTLKGDGTRLWSYGFGPICHQIATGAFDGDKTRGAIYGGGDGCLHYVGPDGKMRLRFQTGEEVRHVAAGDLDGDGRDEILAGSQNDSLYCFGADARLRWRRDLGSEVTALAVARNLVVAGNAAGTLLTTDRDGRPVALSHLQSRVTQIASRGDDIIVATADGRLRHAKSRP